MIATIAIAWLICAAIALIFLLASGARAKDADRRQAEEWRDDERRAA